MSVETLLPISFNPPLRISTPAGAKAEFRWLPLTCLRVDMSYQRPVLDAGRKNIRGIVERFDWTKFAPVIVAPIEANPGIELFALIDGQHRATAALLHPDIDRVPAIILRCTPMEAARAFADINGKVTAVTATQIYHAGVAGGDPASLKIKDCCDRANVTILRLPPAKAVWKRGQTLAVKAIEKAIAAYGADVTATAMMCVTETADGNPGMLKAPVIAGLASALAAAPDWCEAGEKLFDVFDDFSFRTEFETAHRKRAEYGGTVAEQFSSRIRGHLSAAGQVVGHES